MFFYRKNALVREHNFLQQHSDFCEAFFCEGAFVPKRRIHCLHLPVQPLMSWERPEFKSRPCLVQSKSVNLLSPSQVISAATVTAFVIHSAVEWPEEITEHFHMVLKSRILVFCFPLMMIMLLNNSNTDLGSY